jgi:hypothetical protein
VSTGAKVLLAFVAGLAIGGLIGLEVARLAASRGPAPAAAVTGPFESPRPGASAAAVPPAAPAQAGSVAAVSQPTGPAAAVATDTTVAPSAPAPSVAVTLDESRISIQEAVRRMAQQAGLIYDFRKSQELAGPDCRRYIRCRLNGAPLEAALDEVVTKNGLRFKIQGGHIWLEK